MCDIYLKNLNYFAQIKPDGVRVTTEGKQMLLSLDETMPYLVCLEKIDGSGDVKLAGHKKLNSCRLRDEPSAVRLLPAPHLTQELLYSLKRHGKRWAHVKKIKKRNCV